MSTIDPRVAAAERARQSKGSAGALLWSLGGALLVLATGFALGLGMISIQDKFRGVKINPVGAWEHGAPQYYMGLFVGVFGAVVASAVYNAGARRFTGGARPAVGPFTFQMMGAAAGSWYGAGSAVEAVTVGKTVSFGTVTPWSPITWVWYYLPIWLPLAFLALAVIGLIGSIVASRRYRTKAVRAQGLVKNGVMRPGQVSDSQFTGTRINNQPLVRFTITYTDAAGIARWVTKTGTFSEVETPRMGQPATVWYDPERPDDQSAVMVTLTPTDVVQQALQNGIQSRDPFA